MDHQVLQSKCSEVSSRVKEEELRRKKVNGGERDVNKEREGREDMRENGRKKYGEVRKICA